MSFRSQLLGSSLEALKLDIAASEVVLDSGRVTAVPRFGKHQGELPVQDGVQGLFGAPDELRAERRGQVVHLRSPYLRDLRVEIFIGMTNVGVSYVIGQSLGLSTLEMPTVILSQHAGQDR